MEPIHGNIAISAPYPGTVFTDPSKLSIAPLMGGGLITQENGVWDYVDFSKQNQVEGSIANLAPNTFYFVYVYTINRQPFTEISTTDYTKIFIGNVPIEVKLDDSTRTLVGFCYPKDGILTFDPLNGHSLTGNYFPAANKFPIRTQVISGTFVGDGTSLPKLAAKLDNSLDMYVITGPCSSGRFIAQGFIENTDPTSRTKIYIKARSGRWSGWTEQSIATRVYGSGGFCVSYGTAYNSDCAIAELWAATERGTASYSAQMTCQLMAA